MAKIGIMKSVPEKNSLKTCPTRLPGARSASLHPELPQGVFKVNSCSSTGFNLLVFVQALANALCSSLQLQICKYQFIVDRMY